MPSQARSEFALSTRVLVAELVVIALLGTAVFSGWQPPALLGYRWHLLLHVLGAVISLGNFVAGAFWLAFTGKTGAKASYPFVSAAIQWADVILSAPGVLLLLYNGGVIVGTFGGVNGAGWLRTSTPLAIISGALWAFVLVPLQHRLLELSRRDDDRDRWERLARWYSVPGTIAGLLALVVLALMVVKP